MYWSPGISCGDKEHLDIFQKIIDLQEQNQSQLERLQKMCDDLTPRGETIMQQQTWLMSQLNDFKTIQANISKQSNDITAQNKGSLVLREQNEKFGSLIKDSYADMGRQVESLTLLQKKIEREQAEIARYL
jgi:uncharacterized protein YaaR (DUF327 family)